jgi:hypothetical protein
MLFTSQDRRPSRSILKLRHDLAGPFARWFRCRRFTVGTIPRGTTRLTRTGITAVTAMQQATMP